MAGYIPGLTPRPPMPQSPDEELQPPGSGIGQKASSVLGQAAAGLVTGVVPGLTQTVSDAGQAIAQSEQGIGSQRAGSGSFPEKPQVDLSGLSASGPVTQSQTQSTYQSPDFDPRLFPQYQRNMQEHLQRVEDISRQREVVIGQKAEIYNKWITQNQADSEKYGRMADEYLGKFQAAEKQLEGIKARLDSLEPDEVLGAASDAQSIVAALGMALSRYSTLGTGGAINLLNQMEKQNMEKHRIKMANTLQLAGLTKDQMNAAWGQYMSFEGRRREATQGLIQMELAKVGLESDRIDVRAKYADIINASNNQLLEKKNATRAKTSSTTVTKKKTSTGGTGGLEKAEARKLEAFVSDTATASTELSNYVDDLLTQGTVSGKLKTWIPGVKTDADAIVGVGGIVSGKIVKSIFGGHASDIDRATIERGMPTYGMTKQAMLNSYANMQRNRIHSIDAKIRTYASMGKREALPPLIAARNAVIQERTEGIRKIQKRFKVW